MNQDMDIIADEKIALLLTAGGFYRSRIYSSSANINPLVAACDQLLSLAATLKTIDYPEDSAKFLQDLVHEIRSFEHRAQLAKYPPDVIVAARYAVCCLLDETIAQTPWGQENSWDKNNLLSLFHNETYGGVRFFVIIDDALKDVVNNLHLIELLYLCLNFGFTGKYQKLKNGQNKLVAITNDLYQIIGQYSLNNQKNILISNEESASEQNDIIPTGSRTYIDTKKLLLLAVCFAITISGLIYLGISLKLNYLSKPIYTALEQLAKNRGEN